MGMTDAIDLTTEQRNMLNDLLRRFLPGAAVWAYGSRVKWTARPNSDLDLVAFTTPAQRAQVADLKDALAESNLPFPVDLHVWDEVPERFREIIGKEYVVVQEAKPTESKTSIPGEWCNITLGQVTDFLSGGTPSKDVPQYWDGTIPWVSAKDMKRFRLDDTEDHVTEVGVANGTKLVPSNTALLLARGMTLLNDMPICVVKKPMTFNQDVKALRPKPGVQNEFLPYLLLGNKERLLSLVDLAGHGTGRLNSDELKALDVVLPPEPEQRAIAHILGTLDDKIELNRRMSETLEAMARALFKSWFVDFDPVRAKATGRNTGLPKHIADLFPDSFEDSEMGEIPRGWNVKSVGVLADVVGGTTPSTKEPAYWDGGTYAWATPKDLSGLSVPVLLDTERRITDTGLSQVGSGLLPKGTVLLSSRAPIGYLAVAEIPVAINQGFIAMVPKTGTPNLYLLLWASVAHDEIVSRANGSTFLEISKANFRPIPIVAPSDCVMHEFEQLARPLYERIVNNVRQSRTLTALRDTLLPKLISGELRVKDAERVVERGCEPTA